MKKSRVFSLIFKKGDDETLACYYTSKALNCELCGEFNAAFQYHLNAEKEWNNENEPGFLMLTYRHLINLGLALSKDTTEFSKKMHDLAKHETFRNIDIESLYREFEKKLGLSKQLVGNLKELESELDTNQSNLRQEQITEPLWKQAVKLRIFHALNTSEEISKRNENDENLIKEGKTQLLMILEIMKKPMKAHVENQIKRLPFSKGAVNNLKSSLNKIRKVFNQLIYGNVFDKLLENLEAKQRVSMVKKRNKLPSVLLPPVNRLIQFYRYCMTGDYLVKCNRGSNSRHKKFLMLATDGTLRWSGKNTQIGKSNKFQSIPMSDVVGILYGKKSKTLMKPYNKNLEPQKCFSIMLTKRTLDFFHDDANKILKWVCVLSAEAKKQNPIAVTLSVGKALWQRFMQRIIFLIFKSQRGRTFVKALLEIYRQSRSLN